MLLPFAIFTQDAVNYLWIGTVFEYRESCRYAWSNAHISQCPAHNR